MGKSLRELFINAREILSDRKKWGKNDYEPKPGTYCLLGACAVADGLLAHQGNDAAYSKVLEPCIAKLHPRIGAHEVYEFNDRERTRHKDILAVLDCAIECSAVEAAGHGLKPPSPAPL